MTVHVFTTTQNYNAKYRHIFPESKGFKVYPQPISRAYFSRDFNMVVIMSLEILPSDTVMVIGDIQPDYDVLDFVDGDLANRFNRFYDVVTDFGCPFIYVAHFLGDYKPKDRPALLNKIETAVRSQMRLDELNKQGRALFLPDATFPERLKNLLPEVQIEHTNVLESQHAPKPQCCSLM